MSRDLAEAIQSATKRWGQPNAYVLGQEAGGAFVGGLRYGEGTMYTRNAGDRKVFWQGPSLGFDYGADGDRTMMLVYNLPSTEAIFQRFVGVDGSAYLVGGFGVTALTLNGVTVVPIRTGARRPARAERRLSEIHRTRDLESFLTTRRRFALRRQKWQRAPAFGRIRPIQSDFHGSKQLVEQIVDFALGFRHLRPDRPGFPASRLGAGAPADLGARWNRACP